MPESTWRAFTEAGFSTQQALDAVLGTSVYVLSTFTNVLTGAPLDAAFEAFRWEPPATTTDSTLSVGSHAAQHP